MELKEILRNSRIIIGIGLGISAIFVDINGSILDAGTLQFIIVSTFAIILVDAPKEN